MKSISRMSQAELAAYVQTYLASKGIHVVLSGGAAVAFYVGVQYVSKDIDLIAEWPPKVAYLNQTMREIGFQKRNRYFTHPDTEQLIEVLPGPLTAGEEHITTVDEVILKTGTLRVLSATDCTKERLAAFIHWNDTQSLEQAVLIAKKHKVNLRNIKRWAQQENALEQFRVFLNRVR